MSDWYSINGISRSDDSTPSASVTPSAPSVPTGGGYSSGGGNTGYAYTDRYGIGHVSYDPNVAAQYGQAGSQYNYAGSYGGGYALDGNGNPMNLPGATYNSPNLGGWNGGGSLTPFVPTGAPQQQASFANQAMPQWMQNLEYYKANPAAGYAEIARAGTKYQEYADQGYDNENNPAHIWANQIRDALGLRGGVDYDPVSGASLGGRDADMQPIPSIPIPQQPEQPQNRALIPSTPQYAPDRYMPVTAPFPGLQLSSGGDTIMPTMDYQRMQYGLQDNLYNRGVQAQAAEMAQRQYERQLANDQFNQVIRQAELEARQKTADASMLRAQKAGSGTGAKQPSDSDIKRENMADAQAEIYEKISSGTPVEQIEALIIKNASKYSAAGVNPYDLVDYAWYAKTGAKKPKPQPEF